MPATVLTRREWLARSCLVTGSLARKGLASQRRLPNLVLILADDLGYGDLSSYGAPDIRTPAIDSIGTQGIRFTHCYANAPECTPTRAALLTGRYQQRVGGLECAIGVGNVGRYNEAVWLQQRGELGLPASEWTISRILKTHGYATACVGKWHLGYLPKFWPDKHGFDEFFGILGGNADYFRHVEANGQKVLYHNGKQVDRDGYLTDLIAEHAIHWLRRRKAEPFFLYLAFTAPHTPVQAPEDRDKPVDESNWEKGDRATYARMVERMDQMVGAVLEQLDRMGAAENTLVVFLSDNGGYVLSRNEPFRGRKSQLWEGGIRVPALMRWPARFPQGRICEQVIITMDLLPTFLAAAGLAAPRGVKFDGVDITPVLMGAREPFPRKLFWRYKRAEVCRKAALDGSLKYLWNNGEEELYDLQTDPCEACDLKDRLPEVLKSMRLAVEAWEREVQAPRLKAFRSTACKANQAVSFRVSRRVGRQR